jgi:isopenicillin N synthase-like dioxygenase
MSYVPVVDISADPGAVGRELDEICRTAGFFQVTGHGIPDEVAERAWTTATRFFDLPLEDKLSVARPAPDYPYGYIPLAGESLSQSVAGTAPPDLKEVFNAGRPARPPHPLADPGEAWAYSPSLWPAALPELRVAWTAYYDVMRDLGNRLMSLFARGLELPPGFFAGQTGQAANALRAINYPARDTAPLPGQLRAGAHTDYGTLTILRQDAVGGLEVLDLSGRWVGVEPVPGAFVINMVCGGLLPAHLPGTWREAPLRTGARRAAPDGQVPPVGQLVAGAKEASEASHRGSAAATQHQNGLRSLRHRRHQIIRCGCPIHAAGGAWLGHSHRKNKAAAGAGGKHAVGGCC